MVRGTQRGSETRQICLPTLLILSLSFLFPASPAGASSQALEAEGPLSNLRWYQGF